VNNVHTYVLIKWFRGEMFVHKVSSR